ncbi:MAG: NUDIX domain-containing protein, partial [Crenarchaeota archaeon]|nr:NUDIX domain-containing protein [Thermoproteota archaeon]
MKRTYPEMPLVGVGALVIRDGKILLVKRKYPPGKGRWSIPGGHVEVNESILEAARRELLEETGIEGDPLGVVNVDDAIIYDDDGKIK